MTDLDRAVQTVVRRCLNIRPDEDVVVVVDQPLQELGEKLRDAAQQSGADAVLTVMSPRPTDGSEPPAPVAEALAACDVFIAPASRSLSHTLARKRASEAGARGATMPHVTTDMLARLMAIDFDRLRSRSHAVAELLEKGREAKIACPRGTDLSLDLTGRHGIADDGDLTAPGAFGNLPCGEGFIAPANGNGTMFARLMSAEFDLMAQRSARVAGLLTEAGEARFTCPKGSEMRFDLRGRTAIADDGNLTGPAAFGNLPCGEGFISPAGGSGVLVATSVGHLGITDERVELHVEDGRLTSATGTLGERLAEHLDAYGPDGRHLAELGVGTNDQAQLTGNMLEDEKLLGTVHVAFGASGAIGGTVNVPVHEDSVVLEPTLTIGEETVVEAGRFLL